MLDFFPSNRSRGNMSIQHPCGDTTQEEYIMIEQPQVSIFDAGE